MLFPELAWGASTNLAEAQKHKKPRNTLISGGYLDQTEIKPMPWPCADETNNTLSPLLQIQG